MEIAAQILRHLLDNPQVTDTLEGLARFRLLEQKVNLSLEETDKALRWLVERGLVLQERAGDGVSVYRLNPSRISEALRQARPSVKGELSSC